MKVLELLGGQKDTQDILSTLSNITGPWAFIFWQVNRSVLVDSCVITFTIYERYILQACTSSLWFGRDVFGRRSLLWHLPATAGDHLALSSVGVYDTEHMPLVRLGVVMCTCTSDAIMAGRMSSGH